MNEVSQADDLISVYDKVYHRLVTVRVTALGFKTGCAAAKYLCQLFADLFGFFGDDDGALCSVDTLYDKVHRFQCRCVSYDRVEGKYPAFKYKTAYDIQKYVIRHYKGTYGDAQSLCKYNRHYLDTVHCSAVSYGKAASYAGYHTAEQGAEQEICSCKGRGYADVYGQNVGYEPSRNRIHRNGIYGVKGEKLSLLFKTEQKQGDVQYKQKQRKGKVLRSYLLKQHGRSGYSAVV